MNNKNKLFYICNWGRNKKRAWSGTYYKLFEALSCYCNLHDIGIQGSFITHIKSYLNRTFGIAKYDYMYGDVRKFSRKVFASLPKENVCTLQFTELIYRPDIHSYIYQDMCIDYVVNVIMTNEILKNHYRQRVSQSVLKLRQEKQLEYYRSCKGIFVMGEWLKDYLTDKMHIDAEKIHCVGAGYDIDPSLIKSFDRTSDKILFVGIDFERKGGFLLLDAFKILREKYLPKAQLYIAGPNKNPINCNESAFEGVSFLGRISSEELVDYYCMCDIFCMPSYLEPYGKSYIEALCCGMPVIGRDAFSGPEIIQNGINGYLLENDDPEELAKLIYDLLCNDAIKNNVKNKAQYYIDNYSWKAVAGKIYDVISRDEYMKEE